MWLTRLNDEQNSIVQAIEQITNAESAGAFINTCQPYFASTAINDQGQFIDTTLETFDEIKPPNEIAKNDYGVRLYFMLRKSKPPVTDFLSIFCVVCPHSMTVERCVSTYNLLHAKHRRSASEDTLIDRLLIYWNGVATADYDPRPVVMQFLLKERSFHSSKLTASDSLSKGFLNKS